MFGRLKPRVDRFLSVCLKDPRIRKARETSMDERGRRGNKEIVGL